MTASRPGPPEAAVHPSLPEAALRRRCDPETLGFRTTEELEDPENPFGQERATKALRLAIDIRQPGYNVYALGESDLGMHETVRGILLEHAASQPAPPDWVYVENFARPGEPRALSLPSGTGSRFLADVQKLVDDLRVAVPAAFETREYATKLEEIQQESQDRHQALFGEIESAGAARGVAVIRSPTGVVFAPMRDKEMLSPQEFEALPDDEKEKRRNAVADLQKDLAERLKELPRIHKELRDRVRELDRNVMSYVVDNAVDELTRKFADLPAVVAHLEALRADVIARAADFRREREEDENSLAGLRMDRRFTRYAVNVLTDNKDARGAPVVYEDSPTYDRLIGQIEHYAELGNLITNFSLIKSGSLHRANGGYLVLDAHKVLTEPLSWTALKRALRSGNVDIESLSHRMGFSSSESLRPQPIPLDVKVVLLGSREVFYLLSEHDPEFSELFKIEADFEDAVERAPETERALARTIAMLARRDGVRPLAVGAVARVVEEASRLAGDGRKLSTSVRRLFDLVQQAEQRAKRAERAEITPEDIDGAVATQISRRDRFREKLLEAVTRKAILLDVRGRKIGQVNGLAAMSAGEFTFGRVARITATARMGEGRIIDIEREVELGGPLHSKGVLILTNYLAQRYARQYPLSLSASLVFEQSYSGVEGDSASLAELCALLSALAEVPVSQSIALTGSVNQLGQVQAIGAVNEKIEGFYDACRALGAEDVQGVIVPRANVEHLMLRDDVAEAAARGRLRIYPVDTVDDAMEILTGTSAGKPDENGESPEGTLGYVIEQQLLGFAVVAKRFGELFENDDQNPSSERKRARRKRAHQTRRS
ncbi:MAG TPA: ATP-binding protein [Polyangiaceae bacterium]|nr:ATP-binding protein [Polyangiaceae bacterium]